jgi:type III secretion protein R
MIGDSQNSIVGFALLAGLWLLPFALLMLTSFVKISVVLAILRSAFATEIPPTIVLTGLALILTAHVMAPTARAIEREIAPVMQKGAGVSPLSAAGSNLLVEAGKRAAGPVRSFLQRHTSPADRKLFRDLAARLDRAAPADETSFAILAPAFVVSQLAEAFRIGLFVFMPFLVIDLVIANSLLALGLTNLTPTAVALPFKLLLFVLIDGWRLLAQGLVLGYT